MMNQAVAVKGSAVPDSVEETLGREVSGAERQAMDLAVTDEMSFCFAGEMAKRVKGTQKKVKDYWEPLRVAAKKAYDEVLGKKKEMLTPLENAERILKRKMGDYTLKRQREAREEEARLRRKAEEAANRKLEEAVQAEESGNTSGADFAVTAAEVYEDYAVTAMVPVRKPQADGISLARTWKIRSVDTSRVPVAVNGMEIRPVDERAVMRLIQASKGTISIPGIVYEEDVSVSVRA